jgi:hypothetical protein
MFGTEDPIGVRKVFDELLSPKLKEEDGLLLLLFENKSPPKLNEPVFDGVLLVEKGLVEVLVVPKILLLPKLKVLSFGLLLEVLLRSKVNALELVLLFALPNRLFVFVFVFDVEELGKKSRVVFVFVLLPPNRLFVLLGVLKELVLENNELLLVGLEKVLLVEEVGLKLKVELLVPLFWVPNVLVEKGDELLSPKVELPKIFPVLLFVVLPKVLLFVVLPKMLFEVLCPKVLLLLLCPKILLLAIELFWVPPKGLLLLWVPPKVVLFVLPKRLLLFVIPKVLLLLLDPIAKGLLVVLLDPKLKLLFPLLFEGVPKVFVGVDPKLKELLDPNGDGDDVDAKPFVCPKILLLLLLLAPKRSDVVFPNDDVLVLPKVLFVDPKVFVDPKALFVVPKELLVPKGDEGVDPKVLLLVEPNGLLLVEPKVLSFEPNGLLFVDPKVLLFGVKLLFPNP